ncbi:MAG TPA: DUF5668 domain-containing protein [Terriglobia bacterium]|nr:DUF5668 domain-containing protein [Terriglobia bacterium]
MTPGLTSENTRCENRQKRRPARYGLTWPIILVALGVMFLAGQFVPAWGVSKTWPALLIIIGLTQLLESIWPGRSTPPN